MIMENSSIDTTCLPGVMAVVLGADWPPTGVVGSKGTDIPPEALVAGVKGWEPGINGLRLVSVVVVNRCCVTSPPGDADKGTLGAARGVM